MSVASRALAHHPEARHASARRACARGAVRRRRLGRAAARAASSSGAASSSLPARLISIISCAAPRRTPTSRSAASWRPRSACRSWSGAAMCARWRARAGARSRTRRARRATRFLSDAAASLDAEVIAVGHTPRRSGGDLPAAAAARRGAARSGRDPAARRHRHPAAARGPARRAARLRCGARPAFPRGFLERRRRHSAQPHPPRAAAVPRAVFAGDRRRAGARGGARAGGRRISGGRSNRIGRFDRLTGRQRRRDRRRGARGRFTPLWPPVWRGQLCRQLRPAASSVFSTSTICWSSRRAARTGRRSHCRDWWRARTGPGSCSAAPRRRRFANSFSVPLSIPGEVEAAGWNVSADVPGATGPCRPLVARGDAVVVAAEPLRYRWRSGAGGRATGSGRSVWAGGDGSCRTSWSTEKSPGPSGMPCRSSSTGTIGLSGSSASRWPRIFASRPPRRA